MSQVEMIHDQDELVGVELNESELTLIVGGGEPPLPPQIDDEPIDPIYIPPLPDWYP